MLCSLHTLDHLEADVSTKEFLLTYFEAIHNGGWEDLVAEDFVFVNSNLDRVAHGKAAYIDGAGRFFRSTTAVEVRDLLIEGDRAAVLARYITRSPRGHVGVCDVAEILTTDGHKLTSSAIFFDTKAFAEFMAQP